jgi:hypothetical protein
MANILRFNPNDLIVPNMVIEYLKSVNTPDYLGNILINPDISIVENIPIKYWKVSNELVIEMTEEGKNAIDIFLNSKNIPNKNFIIREYNKNRNLIKESWYEIDNGNGSYSNLSEETEYFYSGKLLYRITKIYSYDGTVLSSERWDYYTDNTKIIEKKIMEE